MIIQISNEEMEKLLNFIEEHKKGVCIRLQSDIANVKVKIEKEK